MSAPRFLASNDFARIVRLAPLVSIDIIVKDPQGYTLLGLRVNEPAKGKYFVPGGVIRKNETIRDAFARILRRFSGELRIPAVMSETHPDPSVHNYAHEDAGPADPILAAKLERAAHLANENCDRATARAHKLSAQLRQAQSRINELELEADERAGRLWAEAETAIAKLQSEANARIERTKREADERIARVEAEADSRLRHLQDELALAQQLTERAKKGEQTAQDRITRLETEVDERLSRTWAEFEDRFIRLKADLAQAKLRADRAEHWLALIRQEIEDRLMPLFTATHDRMTAAESELNVTLSSDNEHREASEPISTSNAPNKSDSDFTSPR